MRSKRFLLILLPVLIISQLWFTYITFRYPFMGIYVTKKTNQWVVTSFEANVPYIKLGLQLGDTILQINDQDPDNYFTVKNFAQIEQATKITISRNHSTYEIVTTAATMKLSGYAYSLIGELVSLCIALMLYLNSSVSRSARFLSFLFLMVGLAFMSLEASPRGDVFAKILISSIVMSLPFVFLHFLIVFFNEKSEMQFPSKFLYIFYGIIGLATLPSIIYITPFPAYLYFHFYQMITMIDFLIGSLLVLAFLIYIYFKFRGSQSYFSNIVRTVWLSFIVSFLPLALFTFLPEIIWHKDFVNPYITGMCTLFFPLSFFYLLSSKQLFDIQLIMRRVLSTTLVSIVPSMIMIVLLIPIFQSDLTLERAIFCFLFMVTLISVLLYSLEYFVTAFEALLFPRKHYLQVALKKISNDVSCMKSFRELKELILLDIVNTLQVEGGAIVFQYENDIEMISEGNMEARKIKQALINHPAERKPYYVYEINRHEEYTSYLLLSPKKTNTLFHKEELQWLKVVLSSLTTSLENLYLIRKLNLRLQELVSRLPSEKESPSLFWLRKTMFDLQEKERMRIAADMHDTTMQDIFFIQRKLRAFQEEASHKINTQAIQDIIQHLDIVNVTLRQNCFELHPPTLDTVGFLRTVANYVDMEGKLSMFELFFMSDEDHRIEEKNMETKRHLFRVVQELLHNAKKHSQASKVTISCTSSDTHFYLEYQDNGIGFEPSYVLSSMKQHSSIGIEQMKGRILDIQGDFQLQTSRGQGVKVQITIPLYDGGTSA